ncbi:MAG: ATP-binding protein [Paracoccaceae bacterium]
MYNRLWPFIILGACVAIVAAILAYLVKSPWIILASVFTIIVVFALIREALRDPVETDELAPEIPKPLRTRFGREMLEQIPLALLIITPNGRIVFANGAAQDLLPHLNTGDHFASLFRAPIFVAAVNGVIDNGQNRRVMFTAGQANEQHYEARIAPLPMGSEFGDTMQVIVEVTDRTKDFRVEQMRSDFIANASHELRTPLASIMGYIETLQGHAKSDPKARGEFLEIMRKQAARMQRLVDDLMSLSRIELNAHLAPKDTCPLNALVEEVVATLQPLQEKYGATLQCDLSDKGLDILADYDQISQVFVNLIDNAMKYGGEGEAVEIFAAPPDPGYSGMNGIVIMDHGGGIPFEHLHRLTERFYRVDAAQSRSKGGTGLGLAIVKHILNRHAGKLQIDSTLGEGSKFIVWLPKIKQ